MRTHHDVGSSGRRSVLEVQVDKMPRESPVVDLINLVEDEVQQVESRDERRREVDVACDGPREVVLGSDGVGSGENGRAGVEGRDDTCLRDRDGLLFLRAIEVSRREKWREGGTYHDFVEDTTGRV